MIRKIRKRDGTVADFNPIKITNAIWKAAQAVGGKDHRKAAELTDKVMEFLERELKRGEIPTVEQVQDAVEKILVEEGHAKTAKAYILYRRQHQDMREVAGLLKDIDVVDDYLSMMDWKVKENSNMSYSLQGLNVYATENIISHYWLNKIYPPEIGDAHTNGQFHIHDLGTLGAYTYYGKETVIVKVDEKIVVTSFQNLYNNIENPEEILSEKDKATAKYPKEIEVLDKNGWTKVKRVVKKAKQKPMRFIKNEGGRSVIVTEDHPMVLGNEIYKKANDIAEEDDKLLTVDIQQLLEKENLFSKKYLYLAKELYEKGINDFFIEGMPFEEYQIYSNSLEIDGIVSTSNNADALPNKIDLTENLGYLIGFYLAEGCMGPHRIGMSQKDTDENQKIIKKLKKAANEIGCRLYSLKRDEILDLRIVNTTFVKYLLEIIFNLKQISKEKHLPDEILNYNQDFVEGMIAGIIDGDSSITTSKTSLEVRIASRTMLEQMALVMNILGFTVRDRNLEGVGTTRYYNGRQIIQHYPLYGISFRTIDKTLPSLKYNSDDASSKAWRAEGSGWHKVLNNEPAEIMDDYIYDITTETNTLIVNGMWNHNCVGWDLKDILLLGFKGVAGKIESKPAKHFGTALMQIVNYLYTLQGEAAGAQALSNFDSLLAPFIRYDGLKYKDVKQEMQKFLFNMNVPTRVGFQSLAHDEPIIFRKNGKIKVELIGKLIEENFGENRKSIISNVDGYGNPSNDSFAVKPNDKFEVISFNKNGEIQWRPVKALIKHRVKTNGFKKIRTGSGEIKVSPAHSLFKCNSNHIKPVMANELECAKPNSILNKHNHILAVNKLKQNMLGDDEKIDFFDLIEELPEKIKKRIFIKARDVPLIKEKIGKLYSSIKEYLYKNGRSDKSTLYEGFKNNIVPFETYIKYSDEIRDDAKIYIKPYNNTLYDRYLSGEKLKNFVKLVAWFVTEGKASHSGIVISQRKSKNKEILDVAKALGIKVTIDETRGYSNKNQCKTDTIISNMKMSGLYTYLLPYLAGATAREKTVPSFIFNLDSNFRNVFLETLFKGDGYLDKKSKRITYSSMSDKLLTGISTLSIVNKWRVRVVPKSKGRAGTLLIYKNPRKKLDIALQETAGSPVYEINDYKNDWDWEYDISVDINGCEENFVGGTGLIFYHNSPFTNVTLDLTLPSYLKEEPVIRGGDLKDDNYSDFTDEMDMINRAFAEVMLEGDAKGRPMTFPIPTYNITKDFKWDNDGLNPIWEMTAKYGVPYFSNFINSDMKPEDARSMCCRLRLSNRELRKRGGGLFGANPKTGCYDVKTEILTENGWKFFKDVKKNEKVFTLTENNEIELHKPTRFFEYDYDNEMYHFKSRSFDLLVTPNHRMVVENTWTKERKFIEAQNFVPNTHRIPKQGIWNCKKKNYFELPPASILSGSGPTSRFSDNEIEAIRVAKREGKSIYQLAETFNCNPVTIHNICKNSSRYGNRERVKVRYEAPPLKIKIDDWLKFFGFWLAEGCTDNEKIAKTHGYRIFITQTNKQKRKEIMRVLDALPFTYALEGEANFVICNKQLWNYLRQFGDKHAKFIPSEIKELTREKLKILFDWMVKGDGHERQTTGQINYWTSSKQLADDVQEVVLKLGWLATIKKEKANKISIINGRKITSSGVYTIGVHRKSKHFRLRKENIQKKHYKGKVFCLEVPNHTLYVRRNGKPCWCGNSIGVVTINMPQIGYLAKDDNDFFERLDQLMELAKQSLIIKREIIENLTSSGLHPYSKFYLNDVKKTFGEYWKNHFSTIGLIGMNDALLNFMNKSIGDPEGKQFAEKVLDRMRDKIADFQVETGDIFNLEATPAEGASYRLSRVDKEQYPDIRTYNQEYYGNGGKVEPYYTNSSQLPVGYTTDVFEALDLQDSLQSKYTGGTVLHIFLGEEEPSPTATKKLVRKVAENYSLPYYTITPTFSVCPDHGYMAGEHRYCPTCKTNNKTTECEVYSRVVGYLRPVNQWNRGKQQEFTDRKTFDMKKKVMVTA